MPLSSTSFSDDTKIFFINKRNAIVCVLSDIKSAVFLCISLYLSGYRYLGDGDTDRREILHDGRVPDTVPPLLGYPQWAQKSQILTANISKTVSHSVTCQMGRTQQKRII